MDRDIKKELKYSCKRGILVLQEMKDREALASPGMRQAAAEQISLLLFYQSIPKVPSPGSSALHKYQLFCQDVGLISNAGAEATLLGPSSKLQPYQAHSLLAIQPLMALSPCLSFFLWRKEEKGNLRRCQLKSETRQQSFPTAVFLSAC